MKQKLLPFFILSFIFPQEESAIDTSAIDQTVDTNISLDFGYKGYQWGSQITSLPVLENFSDAQVSPDNQSALLLGILGLDTVSANYVYSDSGFWKVEIDFDVDMNDVDAQIEKFLRLEKNIAEVYGNPFSTEQTVNGPSNSYNNILNIKFSRSFSRSSWNVAPARIILILNGIVQQPHTKSKIVENDLSFLKLIYYNPDYMKSPEDQSQEQELPSIYDIY